MLRVRITTEYVAGIVAGIGVGLAIHPLIERWIAPQPSSLGFAGALLACVGGCIAIYAQRNSGQTSSTRT